MGDSEVKQNVSSDTNTWNKSNFNTSARTAKPHTTCCRAGCSTCQNAVSQFELNINGKTHVVDSSSKIIHLNDIISYMDNVLGLPSLAFSLLLNGKHIQSNLR